MASARLPLLANSPLSSPINWNPCPRMLTALFCLSTAGIAILFGCKQEAASSSSQPPPEVGVVTIETQTVPDEPEFIGQAEASRIVEIRSQVTGIIQERSFQEGREIKKGEKLYRIDPV